MRLPSGNPIAGRRFFKYALALLRPSRHNCAYAGPQNKEKGRSLTVLYPIEGQGSPIRRAVRARSPCMAGPQPTSRSRPPRQQLNQPSTTKLHSHSCRSPQYINWVSQTRRTMCESQLHVFILRLHRHPYTNAPIPPNPQLHRLATMDQQTACIELLGKACH
jgi:hypothetical protein